VEHPLTAVVLSTATISMASLVGCGGDEVTSRAAASVGNVAIYDAYAPAAPLNDVGSLYFTIVNRGDAEDTLAAVTITAGHAQLHEVVTVDDVTRMRPLTLLPIPAHGLLKLAPGGYHVMLSQLGTKLGVGDSLEVQLTLSSAGTIAFKAAVLTYSEVVRRLEESVPNHP
jgi:copper(I)-binding protein